jgi:hypothetical protein
MRKQDINMFNNCRTKPAASLGFRDGFRLFRALDSLPAPVPGGSR